VFTTGTVKDKRKDMEPPVYSVFQITQEIKGLLESEFPLFWVQGEVSNFREPGSGHYYFVLKDDRAQIRGVMFRHQNRLLPFRPEDGMAVLVLCRLTVYEPRGEYQIVVERMEPRGRGALQLALEQLKSKLRDEGLFEKGRKRPLPYLPRRIVVVTSPTGAAIRDFIHVMDRRHGAMEIQVYPVRVQGSEAAAEIAEALDRINAQWDADVLVITRGGGSLEDLWPFNEEVLARAIFRSRIPVLSAVGHEIDFTISDFVADVRAPTPSVAAELLAPSRADLDTRIRNMETALRHQIISRLAVMEERLTSHRRRLGDPRRLVSDQWLRMDDVHERLCIHIRAILARKVHGLQSPIDLLHGSRPGEKIRRMQEFLDALSRNLNWFQIRVLERCEARLIRWTERLNGLSPLLVLDRGYSIATRASDGRLVTDSRDTAVGERVKVRLRSGGLLCVVEERFNGEVSAG